MGRTTRAGATKAAGRSSVNGPKARGQSNNTMPTDVDVMADPLSSDEDDEKKSMSSTESLGATKLPRRTQFSPPKPFSPPSTKAVKEGNFIAPDLFDLDPSSSQASKRRKISSYDKRSLHTSQHSFKAQSKIGFHMPADLPEEDESIPETTFKIPRALTASGRGNETASQAAQFQLPSIQPLEAPTSKGPKFRVPEMLADLDSSAPSVADSIFDIPVPSQETRIQNSGSSSPLSSHSSVELGVSLVRQEGLAHDDTGDGLDDIENIRCKMCSSRVELCFYLEFAATHDMTKIRQKMQFCNSHKQRRAGKTWGDRGYPKIDWHILEHDRIPKHIPRLIQILRRKAPSFYRDKLDSVVRDSTASRKAINHYLKDGIVEVAQQGYYGPRGARVMGQSITDTISKEMEKETLRDDVVRTVGVGAYVSCVLVPELMLQLVKEDMNLRDDDQAMKILDESTDIGALLNNDDDEVVLRATSEEI